MIEIKKYTTEYPLQMIGELSGICWGANAEDIEKNIKRAWDCIDSGHERTEEFPDIYMVVDGYSAKSPFSNLRLYISSQSLISGIASSKSS